MRTLRRVLLALVIGLVVACGGGEAAAPTPTEAPITLHYVTFGALGELERELADEYTAAHPNIKFDIQDYRQAPINYLTDQTPPDLMLLVPGDQLTSALDQALLTDISDFWQEAGLDNTYPASFRSLSERDGKQYFLPIGYTWNALYYNVAIFQQYGLEPPHTWDEFITLCDTLLADGETPLALSGSDSFMATLWIDYLALRLYGADFQRQLTAGEISYEDDRVRSLFETWRSLIEHGYFLEESRSLSTLTAAMTLVRNAKLDMGRGKAVMILGGPATLNDMPELFRAELSFFPFPIIDPALPVSETALTAGYVVPTAAPHRAESLQYLAFLNSEPARNIVARNVQSASLYVPALAQPDPQTLPAAVQQGMKMIQNADQVVSPYAVSVRRPMQFAAETALRRLLADPRSGKVFDLDGLLADLEAARNKE